MNWLDADINMYYIIITIYNSVILCVLLCKITLNGICKRYWFAFRRVLKFIFGCNRRENYAL